MVIFSKIVKSTKIAKKIPSLCSSRSAAMLQEARRCEAVGQTRLVQTDIQTRNHSNQTSIHCRSVRLASLKNHHRLCCMKYLTCRLQFRHLVPITISLNLNKTVQSSTKSVAGRIANSSINCLTGTGLTQVDWEKSNRQSLSSELRR